MPGDHNGDAPGPTRWALAAPLSHGIAVSPSERPATLSVTKVDRH